MIVAGEASGDLHGAGLARALQSRRPGIEISGMGGVEMRRAGVDILHDITGLAVMGLVEIVSRLREIRFAMRTIEKSLQSAPPDLLVLIDYPGFNLMLAEKARRLNIPILYYISPKVWAWRSGRVRKIKRLVDRLAVILPFEKEFYRGFGMEVDFVGNPLLDSVQPRLSKAEFRKQHRIAPDSTVIGILPGSRRQEVKTLLPDFLMTASRLAADLPNTVFLLPLASTLSVGDLRKYGLEKYDLDIRVIQDDRYDLMAACDAVLAASGTVTLELAILGVPMVVAYRVAPLTWFMARLLVKLKYASLVNLVAGREVVPELLQDDAVPDKLYGAVRRLLTGPAGQAMRAELAAVRELLGEPGAAGRTADIALEMIQI